MTPAPNPINSPRGQARRRIVKLGLCLSVAGCIAWSIFTQRATIEEEFSKLTLLAITVGLALSVLYRVANTLVWWFVLRAQSQTLSIMRATRIWLVAETCRWLPGSVWSYGSRAVMGRNAGLSTVGASSSVALELVITIAAWVAVAVATVIYVDVSAIEGQLPAGFSTSRFLPLFLSMGLVCLAAFVFSVSRLAPVQRKLNKLYQDMRRVRPTKLGLVLGFLYAVSMVLLNGISLYVFARFVMGEATPSLGLILFANSLGWLIGFAAPFAPGGLVVREAAFAAALTTCMPVESGLSLAISWRLLQIGAEVVCISGVGFGALMPRVFRTQLRPALSDEATSPLDLVASPSNLTTS